MPWALVSTVSFGLAGFLLGYLSQRAGWVAGLWASRMAQVVCYIPLAFVARKQLPQIRDRRGLTFAFIAAIADIVGVIGLSVGVGARVRLDHARRERGVPVRRGRPVHR